MAKKRTRKSGVLKSPEDEACRRLMTSLYGSEAKAIAVAEALARELTPKEEALVRQRYDIGDVLANQVAREAGVPDNAEIVPLGGAPRPLTQEEEREFDAFMETVYRRAQAEEDRKSLKKTVLSPRSEFAPSAESGPVGISAAWKLPDWHNAITHHISFVINVFLFGTGGNIARADGGRKRTSRPPGITWVQDQIKITIAAVPGAGKRLEVELASDSPLEREPHAISWADPKTLSDDAIAVQRFKVHRADDGRYLVTIKRPDLECRLAAISKASNEGDTEKVISLAPLVEFD